jgi:hypothetical protein
MIYRNRIWTYINWRAPGIHVISFGFSSCQAWPIFETLSKMAEHFSLCRRWLNVSHWWWHRPFDCPNMNGNREAQRERSMHPLPWSLPPYSTPCSPNDTSCIVMAADCSVSLWHKRLEHLHMQGLHAQHSTAIPLFLPNSCDSCPLHNTMP